MSKELISAMVQAAAGLALGYVVFVDDERLAWPLWLLIVVATTVVTVASEPRPRPCPQPSENDGRGNESWRGGDGRCSAGLGAREGSAAVIRSGWQ